MGGNGGSWRVNYCARRSTGMGHALNYEMNGVYAELFCAGFVGWGDGWFNCSRSER
jgi:hypothetical protein